MTRITKSYYIESITIHIMNSNIFTIGLINSVFLFLLGNIMTKQRLAHLVKYKDLNCINALLKVKLNRIYLILKS